MFGILLAFVLMMVVLGVARSVGEPRLYLLVLAGYVLRLVCSTFIPTLNIYSYEAGDDGSVGDGWGYNQWAIAISKIWEFSGVHYVTRSEFSDIGDASLPPNVFALVHFLNGEPSHLGCVAISRGRGMPCLRMHLLDRDRPWQRAVGCRDGSRSDPVHAQLHLSDVEHVQGRVRGPLRVWDPGERPAPLQEDVAPPHGDCARMSSWPLGHAVLSGLCHGVLISFLGLLACGLAPRPPKSAWQVSGLGFVVLMLTLIAYTKGVDAIAERANAAFSQGTSQDIGEQNASMGSGVAFNMSSPHADFVPKLLYTLFAPFPWQAGSIALHLAKIEVLAWYVLFFQTLRTLPRLWRTRRGELLLLGSFILPVFYMYTITFTNIGIVVRERLGAVMAVWILGSSSWRQRVAIQPQPTTDDGVPVHAPT